MSKKIIYLLSLLMALSLVFASCKKNSVTDALGGQNQPPSTGGNDGNADKSTGLYPDSDSMPNDDEFIRRDKLFNGEVSGNYHRNPVIVAGRDGAVFIFLEKRYLRAGGANDIGIDGQGKVDVVYLTSKNSGKDMFQSSETKIVGTAAASATDSQGAPIVFYKQGSSVKEDTIVIAVSSGSGFGRTTADILKSTPSKVKYIVGGFTDNYTIEWGTWKTIDSPNLSEEVAKIDTGNNGYTQTYKMQQFGTHSHRGVIKSDGTLVLPLVIAQQGTTASGEDKELMGVYVLEGTLDGNGKSATVNWSKATGSGAAQVGYKGTKGTITDYGQWKASEAVPTTDGTSYEVLTVPSPVGRANNNTLGKHTGNGDVQLVNGLNASEGSFGYLLTAKWFGADSYKTNAMTSGSKKIIYSHVQSRESQLTLYVLDENRGNPKKIVLGASGKSSSVDMLPDGTVIIAAENTKDNKGYFLYFERRSQAQLARLAQ